MIKRNYCVVDIETKGLSARPESFALACVYGWNNEGRLIKEHFLTVESVKKYIFSQKDFKYFFAHNAEYDFTGIFDNIILHLDNAALFVGSMFIKAKCDGIIFMNSLAILKTSVQELGKQSGDYKLNLDDKFKNWKKGDGEIKINRDDLEYCFKDCQIVYDYLEKVFEYTEKLKPTIASCAMEIFQKKYLQRNLFSKYGENFRHSYYGGRVECFKFGKINPCYKYDVNSLYPFVCTDMYFPDFGRMKKGKSISKFKNILSLQEGCALVKVRHKQNFVGVLPYRKDNEIIYPFGVWVGWYNFNELRKAVSTGLVDILEVREYIHAPKIYFKELADYMKFFYDKKNNSFGAEKMIFKFLLNALTGKFSQKEHGEKRYFENVHDMKQYLVSLTRLPEKYNVLHFSEDREDLFLEIFRSKNNQKPSRWNNPAVSSYITSQARIYMLDFYLKYQKNLCYTDTDSLVLSRPMDEKVGNDMGQFKKEHDESIEIIGNKHYYAKVGRKKYKMIKGVHKKHTKKKGKFCFTKMIRTKEGIRRKIDTGIFVSVEKLLTNDYTKRTVIKNKTQPLKINLP